LVPSLWGNFGRSGSSSFWSLGMSIGRQHEIHKRRFSRNMGLGLVLAAFVVLVFGLTVVKVTDGNVSQAISGSVAK